MGKIRQRKKSRLGYILTNRCSKKSSTNTAHQRYRQQLLFIVGFRQAIKNYRADFTKPHQSSRNSESAQRCSYFKRGGSSTKRGQSLCRRSHYSRFKEKHPRNRKCAQYFIGKTRTRNSKGK